MSLLLSYNSSPRINELSVKRSANFKVNEGGEMPIKVTYALATSDPSEESTCEVKLTADLEGEDTPLDLNIEVSAIFSIAGEPTNEELQKAGATIGGPILFTATREYVADTTRKMGYPPLLLPYPNFENAQPKEINDQLGE